MAMRYIGDPDYEHPSGGKTTFRFFDANGLFAVVQNSHLESFRVNSTMTGASRFEVVLKCPIGDDFTGIREALAMEMYVCESNPPSDSSHRLLAGRIDFAEIATDKGKEEIPLLRMQGRSIWGGLIDGQARGQLIGQAGAVFHELSGGQAAIVPRAELAKEVEVLVSCPSAYGAMRLLALSLNCVVQNHEDQLIVDTVTGARQRLEAKPPLTLTDKEILAATATRGTPVRRRESEP